MTSTLQKVTVLFEDLQNDWVDALMAQGLQDSDGKPLTEAFLREHLKVEERRAKPGRKAGSKNKTESTDDSNCCSAVKHQRTKGNYAKAICGKADCTRDDGKGNLLCEDCGARWDTVSSNDIGGQICYAVGIAAKKGYGGAEWLGIHGKDCPPVFLGQSCGIADASGNWDMRASMDKVSKDGDRRKGAFHKSLAPWADDTAADGEADGKADGEADGKADGEDKQLEEDSSVAPESTDMHDIDGAVYVKVEHDGDTYLYRAYGDDMPDITSVEAATAQMEKGGKTKWLDDDYEEQHDAEVEKVKQ